MIDVTKGRKPIYPWRELNVGEYFYINQRLKNAIVNTCAVNIKYEPKKFKASMLDGNVIVTRIL